MHQKITDGLNEDADSLSDSRKHFYKSRNTFYSGTKDIMYIFVSDTR